MNKVNLTKFKIMNKPFDTLNITRSFGNLKVKSNCDFYDFILRVKKVETLNTYT